MRMRAVDRSAAGAVSRRRRSILGSRTNRCSARLSTPRSATIADRTFAAKFLDRETRWLSCFRSSHREIPARTEPAAAFGAIGVADPQVRRRGMSNVQPASTDNPATIPNSAEAEAKMLHRRTRRGSQRSLVGWRSFADRCGMSAISSEEAVKRGGLSTDTPELWSLPPTDSSRVAEESAGLSSSGRT